MTSLGTREPLMSSEVLPERTIMTTLEEISQQLGGNERVFWRWLKNIRGRSASIPNLKYMGNVVTAAVDKAKVFNAYFCSTFTRVNFSNLTLLRNLMQASWSTSSIDDVVISEDAVFV